MFIGYIPATIRYDQELSPRDKLIYCEITATLDKDGICTKNNIHFANTTGCTKSTVSASMTKLRERGYISIVIEKDQESQKFRKRYIVLTSMSDFQGGGNPELEKAMSDFQGGVTPFSATSSEGGDVKTITNTDDSLYNNSYKVKYIYSDKRDRINYNQNITQGQLQYLKKIVTDFYSAKHKQFPEYVKAEWHQDNDLTIGSVNTLYDLITKDSWDEKGVRDVIRWAIDDDFWSKNLLSLKTLRSKSANGMSKFANLHLKFNN